MYSGKRAGRTSIVAMLLVVAMLTTGMVGSFSKTCRFSDVSDKHWAAKYIEALADGGLVEGYGNNKFGPDDTLKIDELAMVICNAKGHITTPPSGKYWGYEAVRYLKESLYLLPNLGEITKANYSVPCSRELGIYLIVKALGVGANSTVQKKPNLTFQDIPDYYKIDSKYAATIVEGYRLGLIEGTDSKGTFAPKATFTRAELCTMLYRTGTTKAADKPVFTVVAGKTNEEVYDAVKAWGWREFDPGTYGTTGYKELTSTDAILGGISVKINTPQVFTITMPEENGGAFIVNGKWADAYGNPLPQSVLRNGYRNENGKFMLSSGWSYEARQKVKEVLKMLFPESYDEAYNAMLSVMKQEIWEIPFMVLPSAIRVIDGKVMIIKLDESNHIMQIVVDIAGEMRLYDDYMADPAKSVKGKYHPANNRPSDIPAMYELSRG